MSERHSEEQGDKGQSGPTPVQVKYTAGLAGEPIRTRSFYNEEGTDSTWPESWRQSHTDECQYICPLSGHPLYQETAPDAEMSTT